MYVSFTKAPKSGLLAQTKTYSGSGLLKASPQPQHVDCVEGVENLPLLGGGGNESGSSASGEQSSLTSSLRPHEICLVSV